jgi:hypothetical protein
MPLTPVTKQPPYTTTPINVASTDNAITAVSGSSMTTLPTAADPGGKLGGGVGVSGGSGSGTGVYGLSQSGMGVVGIGGTANINLNVNVPNVGVYGSSGANNGVGVQGVATESGGIGIQGVGPIGVHGQSSGVGGQYAGKFDGDVLTNGNHHCTGTLTVDTDILMPASDFAEDFEIAASATVEPGTVMVLSDDGTLQPSRHAYDTRIAGVISGAGDYKPGIILDKRDFSGSSLFQMGE